MQLTIDSGESKENLRLAASFLLHLVGDIVEEPTAAVPAAPTPPADPNSVFPTLAAIPPPPPPVTTADAPVPPPPAPPAAAAPGAVSASTAPTPVVPNAPSPSTAAAPNTATEAIEYDSAGLPWDARIHQKKKSKKQDGTWKLLKGIDMTLVASVVAELTANKPAAAASGAQLEIVMPQPGAASPPASSTVPVPPAPVGPAPGTVPVPPPPAASAVPAPPVPPSVPAAAASAVGALPAASGYRELIQKCSAATRNGKLDPAKLQSIVQKHGAPNVQGLRDMPNLIPDVDADIEALLLGAA